MRTRSKIKCKVKRQWAREIYQINAKVAFLNNKVKNGLRPLIWSICIEKLRQLVGMFYEYCMDNVSLVQSKDLFIYGHIYYFENCPVQTLNEFLDDFPTFPSHYEWKQYVAISMICRKMIAFHLHCTSA